MHSIYSRTSTKRGASTGATRSGSLQQAKQLGVKTLAYTQVKRGDCYLLGQIRGDCGKSENNRPIYISREQKEFEQ